VNNEDIYENLEKDMIKNYEEFSFSKFIDLHAEEVLFGGTRFSEIIYLGQLMPNPWMQIRIHLREYYRFLLPSMPKAVFNAILRIK